MKLTYENALGSVMLTGGGAGVFRLTKVLGLSFPETDAVTVRYANEPGQTLTGLTVLPRTITAAGDIRDKTGRETARAARIFSSGGMLTVAGSRGKRRIPCRCTSFTPENRRGVFVPFTLQLICDYPYFEDATETRLPLATQGNLLTSPFTLPTVFSRRTSQVRAINSGTAPILPVLELSAKVDAWCENGILLENRTTGASLFLSCAIAAEETLTIDCENRKIFGSLQGNLLGSLSADTPMSAFYLAPGINDLAVSVPGEATAVSAHLIFRNKYGEAMI